MNCVGYEEIADAFHAPTPQIYHFTGPGPRAQVIPDTGLCRMLQLSRWVVVGPGPVTSLLYVSFIRHLPTLWQRMNVAGPAGLPIFNRSVHLHHAIPGGAGVVVTVQLSR